MKCARVSVADDFAVGFRDKVRKLFQNMPDARGEFAFIGHIVFKRNGGFAHIRRIDGKQCRRV